jgi:hypothetical protein
MNQQNPLSRKIHAGEIIKPWLILGPFYEDLSATVEGLTLFEKPGATVGVNAMQEIVSEAQPILTSMWREGERTTFRGETQAWSLDRRPDKILAWGRYNISNHLGAAFLTTVVRPEVARSFSWRLWAGISLRALVAINGEIVYDTALHPVQREQGFFVYPFDAALSEGDNIVTVGLFRLGRMAQVGCRLEVVEGELEAHVQLSEAVSTARRTEIEEEVAGLRLERDVFYPHHSLGVHFTKQPDGPVRVSLLGSDDETLASTLAEREDSALLEPARELDDGSYRIRCAWLGEEEQPVTVVDLDITKATPVTAPTGYAAMAARKRRALDLYAVNTERRPIWSEVARYALARMGVEDASAVDEAAIRETCEFIAARKDCADFVIQGVLRIMAWEREARRLSPEINALMKDTVLGFKYWVDEPGDTVMYMGSENHRLLFHVAEWMAGQLFPTEEFTNSRQRGLYHATKGRMYITEWLRQRGRFGFDEFHSNSYFPIDIAPLLNVFDFAIYEDSKLRQMAGAVLDAIFFILAADTYRGVFGTTHGRSYGINLKYPDFEGTSATCWVLYGTGSLVLGTSGMSPVSLATSDYVLPEILHKIANDDSAVIDARERQGLLPHAPYHANFCVRRTPDYLLSGLQDYRKGEYESSSHVAQVTLGRKEGEQPAVIFWSCPLTSGEGSGLRPDYWSGHVALPRVVQHQNVLALTWRLPRLGWMSHCFFEPARFDEVRFVDATLPGARWSCARVGDGYVGILSTGGVEVGGTGQYAGRELICEAEETTWLVECGRAADWGSFDAFEAALRGATISAMDGIVRYVSPSQGVFVTGWDVVPTVEGQPLQLNGYPLVDSAWAHSDFGSGELRIRFEGELYDIWFNQ